MKTSAFKTIWTAVKRVWSAFWTNPQKRRYFMTGVIILFVYVFINFLRGLFSSWIFADNSIFSLAVAKILFLISYWFGNALWLFLVIIILSFYFRVKKRYVTYGIFGGCLFFLFIFLTGIAAIFRIFF